jgi:general secretion pathway protein K
MSFVTSSPPSKRSCARGCEAPGAREAGWALVSVLWTLTMLALLASATAMLSLTTYHGERHAFADAEADAALDAAVVRAALGIVDQRADRRWRVDGASQVYTFDGVAMRIAVQDERGRIDLNTASGALIRQLLLSTGMAVDDASTLADRISDWRSATGLKSLNGATDADYRAAGLGYAPRHGPFQTVDELKLVLGMPPSLFARIKPALTVYGHTAMFDPQTAPREALGALYPNDPDKVEETLRTREGNGLQGMRLGVRPGTLASVTPPAGRAFSIYASARVGQRIFRRHAVIEFTGDDSKPYFVLAWE